MCIRGKPVCPVLRGAGRNNAPRLPGELVGNYKNAGQEWQPKGQPGEVDVHDFPDPAVGKAIPYGVYDVGANTGWVSVGRDHDTAAFAVATLRSWWRTVGQPSYPQAGRLLVSADSGGSGGSRLRCGRPSRRLWPPRPALRSPCATCRRAPANGTRSNTACSPASP